MSEFERNADFNQGTNIFIKEEPQLVDSSYDEDCIKSDAESHNEINSDEKFVSQAAENISSYSNLDSIRNENLEESSSFSSYVHYDFKPSMNKYPVCSKPQLDSEMCVIKELKHEVTELFVKKEDSLIFEQNASVTCVGFQSENVKTKVSVNFDCFHEDQDESCDLKPNIDIVKNEVDDNADSNKAFQHELGNTHFPIETHLENLICQCKEKNNQIKLENISIVTETSYLATDTDFNKSVPAVDLHSVHSDQNSCTKVEESSCDYHALLVQENLSQIIKSDEDHLTDINKGFTNLTNSHNLGAKQDLLSDSSSCGHRTQPHTEDPFMKNKQTNESLLVRHERIHQGLKPFMCTECSKCFTRKSNLKHHKNIHKFGKPFKCQACSKCFSYESHLIQHERIHNDLKPFQCIECSKCFAQKSTLTQHENIHKGLKPFQCLECSKCFPIKSHLIQHERIHTDLKPYKCLECSKCFTQKSTLTRHENIHKGLRPFKCSECSKCFTRKSECKRHENIHKGLKPFQCLVCSKCFSSKSYLTQHERIHSTLKPFQCLECSKCFTLKTNLADHERTHKGLRPFKCSECSKCFTQKSTLTRHENIQHKGFKPI